MNAYVLPYLPVFWMVLAVGLVILEASTMGLTSIWFAGGALAALVLSLLDFGLSMQVGAFLAVSALLLALVRPVSAKYLKLGKEKTNADRIIGMSATVLQPVDVGHGLVKVAGQDWTARPLDPAARFKAGDTVTVVAISGVKVIVK